MPSLIFRLRLANFPAFVATRVLILALLCFIGWSQSAKATIRDGGINTTNLGKGDWIYILPDAIAQMNGHVSSVTNVASMMAYLKNQGMNYVIIKAANGNTLYPNNGSPQLTTSVINAAHEAGLWIFGYNYSYGTNIAGESAMADYVLTNGADGFVFDAESEWESNTGNSTVGANGPSLATNLCSMIRSNWPNKFLGLSTWGYRGVHTTFPYKEFAYYCDVIIPQDYWLEFGDSAETSVNTMNSQWKSWENGLTGIWTNSIKPFAPTGQGWSGSGTITAAQITQFFNSLKTNSNPVVGGYKGVNFWRAELHPTDVWDAIRTNSIGFVPTTAPTIQYTPGVTEGSTNAVISWPTDQSSDGVVEFGTTTSYGTLVTNSTFAYYHSVTINNLTADAGYHFRVKSKNSSNNTGVSSDYVFTTLSASAADVIVESRLSGGSLNTDPPYQDSGFSDSTLKSAASGLSGTGSRFASSGTPFFRSKPTLEIAGGSYEVYVTHGTATSISDDIVVAIGQSGCSGLPATTTVFREPNGDTWEYVGQMTLNSGVTVPTLTFTYSSGTLNSSSRFYSDATKFVYVPPPPSPPSIGTQPQSQTVNQGNTATFTVAATGTATLNYQWKKNGSAISGATQSSYVKNNVQSSDAGSYSVVVSNTVNSATSSTATLTVIVPPSISTQPQSQTVNIGNNATFTVTASGSSTLSYQWHYNGADISGATLSSYTKSNAQESNAGTYSVTISNAAGTVDSAEAILTVIGILTINTQPQSQTIAQGHSATFSISAAGSSPKTYQWSKNGSSLSGATLSSYAIASVQTSHEGTYSVVVTNPGGSLTSSDATLTVTIPPAITSSPSSQTVVAGNSFTLDVGATGTMPLSYQWRKNSVNISGATESSYTKANPQSGDTGLYSCLVANVAGSATSPSAIVTVYTPPSITTQPQSKTVKIGTTASLSVTATGSTPLSYQWSLNATPISGATLSAFSKANAQLSDGGTYTVVVQNVAGSTTSSDATVLVALPPTIVTQPQNTTAIQGGSATFTVTGDGTGPLKYQWRRNAVAISGATDSGYTRNSIVAADAGSYSVIVSNAVGAVTSGNATMIVHTPPVITTQPKSQTTKFGWTNIVFKVSATGSLPFSYQWGFNASTISGATQSSLTLSDVDYSDVGSYSVVLSNDAGSTTSANATLTINPEANKPTVGVTAPLVTRTNGEVIHITGTASDDVTVSQVLYRVGQDAFVPADMTQPHWKQWSVDLTLTPGTNIFSVKSIDPSGNISLTNVKSYFYIVTNQLTVATNGYGVTTNIGIAFGLAKDGEWLEIGRNYKIKALPAVNNIFTNWTLTDDFGTTLSPTNQLTFMMRPNLVLTANFLTNPILTVTGIYNGLFFESNIDGPTITWETAGAINSVNVKSNRVYSGSLLVGGKTYTLSGAFDLNGDATNNISRATHGRSTLRVGLHLDWANGSKQITGTVEAAPSTISPLVADLGRQYNTAGRYTLLIPPMPGTVIDDYPQGYGYLAITNNPLGNSSANGKVADGSTVSKTAPISKDGNFPLYASLYNGSGLLEGWLNYHSGIVTGLVTWIKLQTNTVTSYPDGFGEMTNLAATGESYLKQTPLLGITNLTLEINDANLIGGLPLSWSVQVNPTSGMLKKISGSSNTISGMVNPADGTLSVSFRPTGQGAIMRSAAGTVLQPSNYGRGAFTAPNSATTETNVGAVYLHP